ncbi:MAG: LPP20 family lipoprotein [Planctomycetota bacterium]
MNNLRLLSVTATLLALAACGDEPRRPNAQTSRDAFEAASKAADASHNSAFAPPAAKPVEPHAKPVSTPEPKAVEKPVVNTVPHGRPAWIDQPPSEPGKLFAVGGAAKGKREAAAAKARQELAAQLRVNIKGVTTSIDQEITKIGPGGERVGRAMSEFRNEATASVNKDLDCTRIVAEAEDGKETWALAELDRVAWATKLRQEIGQVDLKLGAEKEHVATAGSGIRAAAQALRAIGMLAARRDALVADLIQADPSSTPPTCPIDLKALFEVCAKQLATITIKVEGVDDAVLLARIQDALTSAGLSVNEKSANLVLRIALRQSSRTVGNSVRFDAPGNATVVDPASGAIAGSLEIVRHLDDGDTRDPRGMDLDAAQAKSRLYDDAAKAVAESANKRLIDILGK